MLTSLRGAKKGRCSGKAAELLGPGGHTQACLRSIEREMKKRRPINGLQAG
jgi:hypothetical protein